jgi:Uma2 family endonuclease
VRPEVLQRSDYTAEEAFWLNPPGLWELVDGRFVFMSPAGARHGRVVARVSRALSDFVEAQDVGVVLVGDVGFVLRRRPDAVRAPDVAFVRAERVAGGLPAEFFPGPPDLALEVTSPSDRWPDVEHKAREFLAAGTRAVWVIDPEQRMARIYTAEGSRSVTGSAALQCPELLGELALSLDALCA